MNAVIAELQRQAEADRRSMQRQLEILERRQEQVSGSGGAGGRERWAELQGSVSGLLEEMTSLSRRVESLDEKLRARVSGCEELVRQRTRELEQQLHAQQQKASLAISTSEEMAKRHAARLRKVGQSVEEHARRLAGLDEAAGRRPGTAAPTDLMQLEARLAEVEGQQASMEDEFRQLVSVQRGSAAALFNGNGSIRSAESGHLGASGRNAFGGCGEGEADGLLRAIERDVRRLAQGADEHAAALANLRVRSDGQEQRLTATYERLETAVSLPLEALRAEVLQLRDHDRQELESQVSHLSRRVQALAESSEDASAELRDSLLKVSGGLQALEPRGEENSSIRKLMDTTVAQEQSIRRLEAMLREPHHKGGLVSEDLCDVLVRVEALEHRASRLEDISLNVDELSDKADRSDVVRLEVALQEMSEPMRRLSQRTASSEAKTAALERQIERLRDSADMPNGEGGRGAALGSRKPASGEDLAASVAVVNSKADAVSKELSILRARLVEVESQLESNGEGSADLSQSGAGSRPAPAGPAADDAAARRLDDLAANLERLSAQVERQHGALRDDLSRASGGEKRFAEALGSVQAAVQELRGRQAELAETAAKRGEVADGAALQELRAQLQANLSQAFQRMVIGSRWKALCAGQVAVEEARGQVTVLQKELQALSAGQVAVEEVRTQLAVLQKEQKASSDLAEDLEELRTELRREAERLDRTQGELATEVKSQQARVQEELKGVQERDEAAQELLQELREQLQQLQEKMREATSGRGPDAPQMSAMCGRLDKFEIEVKKLQELEDATGGLGKRLDSGLRELRQDLEDATGGVGKRLDSSLREFRQDVDQRLDAARSDLAGRASKVAELLASIEDGERSTQRLHDEVREQLRQLAEVRAAAATVPAAAETASPAALGQLEDLATSLDAVQKRLQRLDEAVDDVRKQVAEATRESAASSEIQDRLQASAQRMAKAEKGLADLHKELSQTCSALESRLDKLRVDHELLKGSTSKAPAGGSADDASAALRADFKDLEAQVKEVMDRVEASEAATSAVREELMAGGGGPAGSGPGVWDEGLERVVLELQTQVAGELEALRAHHAELAKARSINDHGRSEQVEKAVADFARQIEDELSDLREHQRMLQDAKMKALSGEAADAPAELQVSRQLEAQIAELSKQVSDELVALAVHQRELGKAKATVADIAGQMKDVRGMVEAVQVR